MPCSRTTDMTGECSPDSRAGSRSVSCFGTPMPQYAIRPRYGTSGANSRADLRHPHALLRPRTDRRLHDQAVVVPECRTQAVVDVADADVRTGKVRLLLVQVAKSVRVHARAVVLDADEALRPRVLGDDADGAPGLGRGQAVAHSVFHQRLQGKERQDHSEHLRG